METYLKFTIPTFNSFIVHNLDPDKVQEIVQRFNKLMSIDQDEESVLILESIHGAIQAISDIQSSERAVNQTNIQTTNSTSSLSVSLGTFAFVPFAAFMWPIK